MQEQQIPPDAPTTPIIVLITTASLEERRAKCAWCWDKRNPGVPYPEEWSSTICPDCDAALSVQVNQVKAALAARKRGGAHASSQEVRA